MSIVTFFYVIVVPESVASEEETARIQLADQDVDITLPILTFNDGITFIDSVQIGSVFISGDGEVKYPDTLSEHAKAFWEAIRDAYPDVQWGPTPNKWYHVSYTSNVGQPVVLDVEFPDWEAMTDWLKAIGATRWTVSKMGSLVPR